MNPGTSTLDSQQLKTWAITVNASALAALLLGLKVLSGKPAMALLAVAIATASCAQDEHPKYHYLHLSSPRKVTKNCLTTFLKSSS